MNSLQITSASTASTQQIFISTRVHLPNSTQLIPAAIKIKNEKIAAIITALPAIEALKRSSVFTIIDVGDSIIMSGLVDTHVHCNEPGRTDWEGFFTATQAAAAGGVTTIVDMPLNSIPPTTTLQGYRAKQDAAQNKLHVDLGLW
jgi:allantoinase